MQQTSEALRSPRRKVRAARVLTPHSKLSIRIAKAAVANPYGLGPKLGITAVSMAGLPIYAIAKVVDVGEPTVYRWVYGESEPDKLRRPYLVRMIAVLQWGAANGLLPLNCYNQNVAVESYQALSAAYDKRVILQA